MVIHTNGGLITTDAKPYSWTRDMPEDLAQRIVDHYKNDYTIYQITKLNSPKVLHDVKIIICFYSRRKTGAYRIGLKCCL